MIKTGIVMLLSAAVLLSGCALRGSVSPGGGTVPAAVLASGKETAAAEPDLASLGRILRRTETLQPDAAGASLRLAALAGELLAWLEANPRAAEARLGMETLRLEPETTAALRALRETAAAMGEERWRAWLEDAGREITETAPSRRELIGLLDALSGADRRRAGQPLTSRACPARLAEPGGNIQNAERFLNISPENRCRQGRSLL